MNLVLSRILAFATTFALFFVSPAVAETLIMPQELVASATKNACEQIPDFFKRPGMVNPAERRVLVPRKQLSRPLFLDHHDRSGGEVSLLIESGVARVPRRLIDRST
jgi:hypothetical protein